MVAIGFGFGDIVARDSQNKHRMSGIATATRLSVAIRVISCCYQKSDDRRAQYIRTPFKEYSHEVEIRQLKLSTQNRVR